MTQEAPKVLGMKNHPGKTERAPKARKGILARLEQEPPSLATHGAALRVWVGCGSLVQAPSRCRPGSAWPSMHLHLESTALYPCISSGLELLSFFFFLDTDLQIKSSADHTGLYFFLKKRAGAGEPHSGPNLDNKETFWHRPPR